MSLRQVFRISGSDARKFLQGLITNDVKKLDQGLVYAAMLTPQGKYMCDFFLVPDGDDILLDAPRIDAESLIKWLSMYRLRADVVITATDLCVSRGIENAPSGAFRDPRHSDMGWRFYECVDHSQDIDWTALRVTNCIPEHGIELGSDSYILEAGFERLNGVDFRKGCYVGQEVTARMKHKTELRKGFETVSIKGTADIGTQITTQDGKDVGTLFSMANGQAIAYLRFDRANGPLSAGTAQVTRT